MAMTLHGRRTAGRPQPFPVYLGTQARTRSGGRRVKPQVMVVEEGPVSKRALTAVRGQISWAPVPPRLPAARGSSGKPIKRINAQRWQQRTNGSSS